MATNDAIAAIKEMCRKEVVLMCRRDVVSYDQPTSQEWLLHQPDRHQNLAWLWAAASEMSISPRTVSLSMTFFDRFVNAHLPMMPNQCPLHTYASCFSLAIKESDFSIARGEMNKEALVRRIWANKFPQLNRIFLAAAEAKVEEKIGHPSLVLPIAEDYLDHIEKIFCTDMDDDRRRCAFEVAFGCARDFADKAFVRYEIVQNYPSQVAFAAWVESFELCKLTHDEHTRQCFALITRECPRLTVQSDVIITIKNLFENMVPMIVDPRDAIEAVSQMID